MAIIVILFGALFGAIFAAASLVLGFSLITSLVVYVGTGHALSLFLMWRMRDRTSHDVRLRLTEEEIRADLLALREEEERRMTMAGTEGTSLFRLLRMNADRDRAAATARAARRMGRGPRGMAH